MIGIPTTIVVNATPISNHEYLNTSHTVIWIQLVSFKVYLDWSWFSYTNYNTNKSWEICKLNTDGVCTNVLSKTAIATVVETSKLNSAL